MISMVISLVTVSEDDPQSRGRNILAPEGPSPDNDVSQSGVNDSASNVDSPIMIPNMVANTTSPT